MSAINPEFDFITAADDSARPLHLVTLAEAEAFLAGLPPEAAAFLRDQDFTGASGQLGLIPGNNGIAAAALGIGERIGPVSTGGLFANLPAGVWRFAEPSEQAVLGFCLGAYRQRPGTPRVKLALDGFEASLALARAIFLVRDLINAPANKLGPAELARIVADLGRSFGASVEEITGAALDAGFPAVAAVGAGSERPPHVVSIAWRGSKAAADAPLIALCGKGVIFDTGGYDIKPSAGMRLMKKDMGGSAIALGLSRLIMEADLPVRLLTYIGCVENSVSGHAMRPSDVIATRQGLSVEIGNTDAEGRLVLSDLLTAACEHDPAIVFDFATLTGAARVALGPDLPALFCNDEAWASRLLESGLQSSDEIWRLPLHKGYADWLKSPCADLGNVTVKPMGGAITAALFMQNFIKPGTAWAHLDCYCWNDGNRPGRPEGGEATGLRAVWQTLNNALSESWL